MSGCWPWIEINVHIQIWLIKFIDGLTDEKTIPVEMNFTMKINLVSILSCVLLFFFHTSITAQSHSVERIEPPFWWTGMVNNELQLMVYGENIGTLKPELNYKGVKISKVTKAHSVNYLFIDLELSERVKPGEFEIEFKEESYTKAKVSYELKKRKPGSAQRKGFDNSDVLYLITPDRFANGSPENDEVEGLKEGYNREAPYGRHGGDIKGIEDHLDYIKDMGFTSIWLNPILENDQPKWSYHGYATTDYYKVDPRFGDNEEYVALSKKASEMGIGMIMDIIVNHCGHKHWWMEDLPFNDWINFQKKGYTNTNHRKTTLVDPYTSISDRKLMTHGWFVEAMPDLNQNNPYMSKYLIQNTIWWIEYADLTGIRQDTYSYPFRDFMTDWTCAIMNEYPYMNIVGEEWVENPAIIAYWQRGKVNHDGYTSCLPSLMDFPLCFTVHKALNEDEQWGTGLTRLYEMLGNDFLYADPGKLVIFPDNHDMSRIFTQLNEDYNLFKIAMGYFLTTRGIPQIYYGTEILMANPGTDSHGIIRSDFPGGWEGDTINAFTQKGLDARQIETQNWLKSLLNWRKTASVIHDGNMMHYEPRNGVYVYFRYDEDSTIMVAINKNNDVTSLDLERFHERLEGKKIGVDVMTDYRYNLTKGLELLANSITIIELN